MNGARYQIKPGTGGKIHFVLIAENNEPIGTGKSVKTRAEVDDLIKEIQICSQSVENFEKMISANEQPVFRLWNADQLTLLLKSELYSSPAMRDNGIDSVMANGATIKIEER